MNFIGSFARHLIATQPHLQNADILAKIKVQFPQANTSLACIAWYKSDMKKKGTLKGERTVAVVQAELDAANTKVLELEDELQKMVIAQEASVKTEIERLEALLALKKGEEQPKANVELATESAEA